MYIKTEVSSTSADPIYSGRSRCYELQVIAAHL